MGSAVSSGGSITEPAGTGLVQREGSPWSVLTGITPAAQHYQHLDIDTQHSGDPISSTDTNGQELAASPEEAQGILYPGVSVLSQERLQNKRKKNKRFSSYVEV